MSKNKECLTPSIQSKEKVDVTLSLELQKMHKFNTWDSFWKIVHNNNQTLWAAAEKGDLNTTKNIVMHGQNQHPV